MRRMGAALHPDMSGTKTTAFCRCLLDLESTGVEMYVWIREINISAPRGGFLCVDNRVDWIVSLFTLDVVDELEDATFVAEEFEKLYVDKGDSDIPGVKFASVILIVDNQVSSVCLSGKMIANGS